MRKIAIVSSTLITALTLAGGERPALADATGEMLWKTSGTHIGPAMQRIGGDPSRSAIGGYARFDIHAVSLFIPQPRFEKESERTTGIAVYDALFADFFFGSMTSEPIGGEGKLSVGYSFGYEGLVGWRTPVFGALGGIRYAAKGASVGDATADLTGGLGLEARGEFHAWSEAPISAQVWTKPWGESKAIGIEARLPISTYVWLYGRFDYLSLPKPPATTAVPDPATPSNQTISAGLGFGRWG
ncbi:MAG: hypothetical protein HYV09_39395 [Deltaproteobacteria bacterium]|nr:hypothetical protein [Deltaproteobacteria bacterium]